MSNLSQYLKKHFMSNKVLFNILYDIFVIIILGILSIVFYILKPHHMDIPQQTQNVNVIYPYKESTVPSWLCTVIAYVTPLILIIIISLFRKNARYCVFATLSLLLAILITTSITNMGKVFAGRPRPHFYERIEITGEEDDAYKSFPSGHSSTIFCGMMFCFFLLSGILQVFVKPQSWKLIVILIPILIAGTVAISRTRDYHHNFSDILAGSLIGIFSTCLVYFSKFRSLYDEKCFEMKIEDELNEEEEEKGEVLIKDEEKPIMVESVIGNDDEALINENNEIFDN